MRKIAATIQRSMCTGIKFTTLCAVVASEQTWTPSDRSAVRRGIHSGGRLVLTFVDGALPSPSPRPVSKSSRASFPAARSRARSFPDDLPEGSSLQLAIQPRREGLNHWSWTRNVAEILAFSALAKAAIIAFKYGGIIGEVLRYIRHAHGGATMQHESANKRQSVLALYIQRARERARAPNPPAPGQWRVPRARAAATFKNGVGPLGQLHAREAALVPGFIIEAKALTVPKSERDA